MRFLLIGDAYGHHIMFARSDFQGIGVVVVIEVAEQKCRATFLNHIGEIAECLGEVGAARLWAEGDEFADDAEDMAAALLRRYELLDAVAEKNHTHLVVVLNGTESDGGGHLGHQFLLELVMGAETVGAAHVDQQHYRQLAFFFEHLHIRVVEPCRHIPVNAADIVAILVLTHLAESHAAALEGTVVLARKQLPRQPARLDFNLADFFYYVAILFFHFIIIKKLLNSQNSLDRVFKSKR